MSAVVLVGSATMDPTSRQAFREAFERRLDEEVRRRIREAEAVEDPDERLRGKARAILPAYAVDLVEGDPHADDVHVDARGHDETWADMLRLQESGEHPAAFGHIRAPVLMIHGRDDPHPGEAIRSALLPHLPHLEYLELERCGHYPWLERAARDRFLAVLRDWLGRHAEPARP